VGSASVIVDGPKGRVMTVAALVVVNSFGSCVDEQTGDLAAARLGLPGEFDRTLRAQPPLPLDPRDLPWATTLAVIATDLGLSKALCAKVAGIGHDGMARAIRPVHTMVDGDTAFALATGRLPAPDRETVQALLAAAGDCVTRAIGHAMTAAESVSTPAATWLCYRDWLAGGR
jgi:putative pantetheine hydrolase